MEFFMWFWKIDHFDLRCTSRSRSITRSWVGWTWNSPHAGRRRRSMRRSWTHCDCRLTRRFLDCRKIKPCCRFMSVGGLRFVLLSRRNNLLFQFSWSCNSCFHGIANTSWIMCVLVFLWMLNLYSGDKVVQGVVGYVALYCGGKLISGGSRLVLMKIAYRP